MDVLALLLATVFLAGFTQGVTGFGFGLVCMGLLPLVLDLTEAVPLVSGIGLAVSAVMLWLWRTHVEVRRVIPLVLGGLVGVPLGVTFLVSMDRDVVQAALGLFLFVYAVAALLQRPAPAARRELGAGWGFAAGAAGGVIGGAVAAGGPPVIVYASASRWPPGSFKGNLQVFFVLMTLYQLGWYGSKGLLTASVLEFVLMGLPALAAGVWVGHRASRRIDPTVFRRVVLVVLLALGANFLVRSAVHLS